MDVVKIVLAVALCCLLLRLAACSKNKQPTSACNTGVVITANTLGGEWEVSDTSFFCAPLTYRQQRGTRIDTLCPEGPDLGPRYFEDIWAVYSDAYDISFIEIYPDCIDGEVSDTLVELRWRGGIGITRDCVPPMTITASGKPDSTSWSITNVIYFWIAGDSCEMPRGDTLKTCWVIKRGFVRIGDATIDCDAEEAGAGG